MHHAAQRITHARSRLLRLVILGAAIALTPTPSHAASPVAAAAVMDASVTVTAAAVPPPSSLLTHVTLTATATVIAAAASSNSTNETLAEVTSPLSATQVTALASDEEGIVLDAEPQLQSLCHMSKYLAREPFAQWELAPQPYWLIVLSSVVLITLTYCWNWLLERTRVGRALTSHCRGMCEPSRQLNPQDSDRSLNRMETGLPSVRRHKIAREKVDAVLRDNASVITDSLSDGAVAFTLLPAPSFMALQLTLQLAHFIYILCTLHSGQSGWRRYEELYARFLNGGGASLLLPVFSASVAASRAPIGSLPSGYAYSLNLYFVCLCPALLTHGVLIYVFLPLIGLLVLVACAGCYPRLLQRALALMGPKLMMPVAMALNCVFIFLLQSSFNYGTQLYGGTNYWQTIVNEYEVRDTQCYFAAIRHGVQPMIVSLVSLI